VHHLATRFAPKSLDALRIIHPDPRPRDRDAKRRLTHPRFLTIFQNLLKTGGTLHLKTDDHALFAYSCEQLMIA
jgi:tRNA (guanine-N7-)-methyltransferase